MATKASINMRKQAALGRIAQALGVDTAVQGRDADLANAIILERIADAVEALPKPKKTKDAAE